MQCFFTDAYGMRYGSDIPGQLTPTDIALYQLYIEKERAKLGKELLLEMFGIYI